MPMVPEVLKLFLNVSGICFQLVRLTVLIWQCAHFKVNMSVPHLVFHWPRPLMEPSIAFANYIPCPETCVIA